MGVAEVVKSRVYIHESGSPTIYLILGQSLIILQHLVSFNPLTAELPYYTHLASAWILVHKMKLSCAILSLLAIVSGVGSRNSNPGLYYCGQTLLNIECGERGGKRRMAVLGNGEMRRGKGLRSRER